MLDLLDERANRAVMHYNGFLLALRGIHAQAQVGDVRSLQTLRGLATAVAQEYLDKEHEMYREDLYAVQIAADASALKDMSGEEGPEAPWDMGGDDFADWYINELGAQVHRDINAIVHATRYSAMSKKDVLPNFAFKDRAGRQYSSETHIRQIARHGLVQFGVTSYTISAASLGATSLTVIHPEPDHPHNGLILAFDDLPDHVTEVFHPNSRAFLKGVTDVSA